MSAKEEIINVNFGNESLVHYFVDNLYGRPSSWKGNGAGLIITGYSGFDIESKKEKFEEDYKMKIIIRDLFKDIKDKLIYFATSKKAKFSEIDEAVKEIKPGLLEGYLK